MKRKLMFFALAVIGLSSCNFGFKKGDGGLLYRIVTDKDGPSAKPGDFISVNFIIKNDADSVMASSYESGHPASQILQKSPIKGDILTALTYLSEGDSAIIKTNIDSVSKGPRQKGIKGKYVVYIIKVEKLISKGNLSEEVFQGRWQAYMKTVTDAVIKREPIQVKKYITDNNLKVTTTPSGLDYVINKQGTGANAATGDTVSVYYVGKFLSGKVFDTNIKAELEKAKLPIDPRNPFKPLRFQIGTPNMLPGWNEAFQLFNKGTKAIIILPSKLAYGEQGTGPIQPYTPLVFEVELVDIVHPDPNAPKPVAPVAPQVQGQQH